MASNSFNDICDEVYHQLYMRLERIDDDFHRFAPRGAVVQALNDGILRRFFNTLTSVDGEVPAFQITGEEFIQRLKRRKLHDFLATLIASSCSIAATRAFVAKLVEPQHWPILGPERAYLGALPMSLPQLVEIFGNNVDADKFFSKQAWFNAVRLRRGEEAVIPSVASRRLPYLEESPVGEGSFGKVFRVKIAIGHFEDADREFGYNTSPMWMARKDYTLTDNLQDNARVREEHDIMRLILNQSSRGHINIVESYCSLSIGSGYSLFMELAICDLRSYMMQDHPTKPNSKEAKAEILRCAEGLADGLNYLHSGMQTTELESMVCYHMDLTPSNILVFWKKERERDGTRQRIWKLSDFGMSRVKTRHRSQGVERERDFNSLFVRRRQVQQPSLSATLNRRGEGTYLAPESIDSTPRMKTGSDIWSLGCVLSAVFAYLEDGSDGICAYQEARMNHRDADGYDRFFLRGRKFNPTRVHDIVKSWHSRLINKAEARDIVEGKAVKYMLRNLENSVLLINQNDRASAEKVKMMLATTYRMYLRPEEPEHDDTFQLNVVANSMWNKVFSRRRSASQVNVSEWFLISNFSFKGCTISPDASLIAYWTDSKIVVYSSDSLKARDGHREGYDVKSAAEYELNNDDSFWKSVTLTNEYLIASTTGRNLCYIFDLDGGETVGVKLSDRYSYRIAFPFPEIHKLAISPNSQSITCVLRNVDGDRHPGSLLFASLSDLTALAAPRPSVSTIVVPSISSSTNTELPRSPWKILDLEWPAADVAQLSISDERDIHLVMRPDLTAKSREHKIPIMHVSIRDSTMDTLFIESRGYDSRGMAGFFTTFLPFRDGTTCAVVTREKRFHVQTFTGNDLEHNIQKDIPSFRILKLIACQDGEKFLALGTNSANHRVLLVEIGTPQRGVDLPMKELAQFSGLAYGDDFSAVLSEENGEKFVLVATLAGANRRKIYKVSLSEVGGP